MKIINVFLRCNEFNDASERAVQAWHAAAVESDRRAARKLEAEAHWQRREKHARFGHWRAVAGEAFQQYAGHARKSCRSELTACLSQPKMCNKLQHM